MFLLAAFPAGLVAQQSSLTGRVLDSTDAVLPGVTVEAVPAVAGPVAMTVTAADGTYSLALTSGTYDVSFRLLNFATSVRRAPIAIASTSTPTTPRTPAVPALRCSARS